MRNTYLLRFTLAAAAAFLMLGAISCGGSSQTSENANTANTGSAKTKSEYPPLQTSIAQADIENFDGTTFKVTDKKGKVLLLNLWATWCGPCKEEMPKLVEMQDKYGDRGFEVIGLNTNDDGDTPEKIEEFAKKQGLNYTLVYAPTQMQADIIKFTQNGGIPQSLLVDREGNLRGVFLGGGESEIRKMQASVAKVMTETN
jgi:cytochrome c biogenesis protein CcmG/thiol:disulfide interchange protein DsbE